MVQVTDGRAGTCSTDERSRIGLGCPLRTAAALKTAVHPLRLCLVGLVPRAGAAALREVLAGLDEAVELGDVGGFRPELRRIGQATRRTDSVQPRVPQNHGSEAFQNAACRLLWSWCNA